MTAAISAQSGDRVIRGAYFNNQIGQNAADWYERINNDGTVEGVGRVEGPVIVNGVVVRSAINPQWRNLND